MLYLVDEFFQKRALQRRVSVSVTPVGGEFLHVTAPTWLHAVPVPYGGEVVFEDGGFNPTLVRFEPNFINSACHSAQGGFNPTLVRFERSAAYQLPPITAWFQSHIGPI